MHDDAQTNNPLAGTHAAFLIGVKSVMKCYYK